MSRVRHCATLMRDPYCESPSWFRSVKYGSIACYRIQLARFAVDSIDEKAMTAILRSYCNLAYVSSRPILCNSALPLAPGLHTKRSRQHQQCCWVVKAQARRLNRLRKPRAAQAHAFAGATSASAGSGVSLLFAASTLYCIPFYALVSSSKLSFHINWSEVT